MAFNVSNSIIMLISDSSKLRGLGISKERCLMLLNLIRAVVYPAIRMI